MTETADPTRSGGESEIVSDSGISQGVNGTPDFLPPTSPDFSDLNGLSVAGGLTNTSTGQWSLSTLSGTGYYLDLDERFVARRPTAEDADGRMRQDGHPVRLLALLFCRIGFEMFLLVDLEVEGVMATRRRSSPVIRIERLDIPRLEND